MSTMNVIESTNFIEKLSSNLDSIPTEFDLTSKRAQLMIENHASNMAILKKNLGTDD